MRVLCLVVFCASSALAEQSFDGISDRKAEDQLAPEIKRLSEKYPLKAEVRVTVISKTIYGWWQVANLENRILIVDRGKDQNIKTLRHEWEHARQFYAREQYSEEKAYAAEKDDK